MKEVNIRNFSIIAHIDHGKSTLADRFLEITNTISKDKMMPQFLDSMELEREKGITIKLKAARMIYNYQGRDYILNLVDTPGHVDFSYEVSRSLAAVEGVILLVDATQGIQAQTLANLELARKQKLAIIPVVNKIDSSLAKVEESLEELALLLDISPQEILKISAKEGTNVENLLKTVIEKIPPPKIEQDDSVRALIFDSEYHSFKGIVAYVRVVEGEIRRGDTIYLMANHVQSEVKEVGYLTPKFSPCDKICAGEIGYIATGIKEAGKVRTGDTITTLFCLNKIRDLKPLPGYQEPKPMVFASLYPENPADFDLLKSALLKLKLNDPSLYFEQEKKEALGRGFKCGFLGTLHIEIISERLQREFQIPLVISTPSVMYKIQDKKGKEIFVYSASEWPDPSSICKVEEPWVLLEIITPSSQIGKIMEILNGLKGKYLQTDFLSQDRALISYEAPLRSVIANLYEKIKSVSQGYASMNYKNLGYREGKLVKMDILVAGQKEEVLSKIVFEGDAYQEGRRIVQKLKELLPPQQFEVALQAVVGGRIIARETISARRKDVLAPLYGGDVTRKMKLLEKQKRGKELLKEKGRVNIPTKVFLEVFRG